MDHIVKYVINLEERRDRRLEMEQQLHRIGWSAQFSKSERPRDSAGFPSIGARGCFESHLSQLKRGVPFKGHVLLMEDDLNFCPGFNRQWNQAIDALDGVDWSMFYPAHNLNSRPDGLTLLDPAIEIVCAHFVLFHRDIVPLIITELEAIQSREPGDPIGGPMHVDGAYLTIRRQHPNIKTYTYSPSLGYQRSSRSDIADLRIWDRIEFLRPAVSRLREIKRSFRSS